jgi:glycosyltransferase involved in cell wall biosynthesis
MLPSPLGVMPGQRYRIEQWEPWLSRRGVKVVFQTFKSADLYEVLSEPGRVLYKLRLSLEALRRRAAALNNIYDFDAVYLYNEAAIFGPPVFEHLIKRANVPLIFDFDDAIFLPSAGSANGLFRLLKFPWKTRTICRLASHVIVGNAYLADYVRQFNDRVTVVPSTIDLEKYRIERRAVENVPPVIGWSGSQSTLPYLNLLAGPLRELAREERFRLRVIGAEGPRVESVEVESLPWRASTEVADLRAMDIGIMPLPDNGWTRGKCGMKALQYMSLGIPTVCSPVGVNSRIIRDGKNGLLAATDEEWVERLTSLLRSPSLRARLGAAGRLTVEANYSASVHAPRVYEILKSIVRRERVEDCVVKSYS